MPPFYIGSSSIKNVENGYFGSVSSKQFKNIFKLELKNNLNLFKIKIIKRFENRNDALLYERKIHVLFNVMHNPLYINMKNAVDSNFFGSGSIKNKIPVNKNGKTIYITSEEKNFYLSLGYKSGQYFSEESRESIGKRNKGSYWANDGKFEKLIKGDLPDLWSKGRLSDTPETRIKKSKSKIGKSNKSKINMVTVKDKLGYTYNVSKDDPKFISGELVGINKNKVGLANHLNIIDHECEFCGKKTNKANYRRWHGTKCTHIKSP